MVYSLYKKNKIQINKLYLRWLMDKADRKKLCRQQDFLWMPSNERNNDFFGLP